MRTTTFARVRDQAATLAGRTPGEIPTTEATMLLGFLDEELRRVWGGQAWPDLLVMEQMTVADRTFSKRDGSVVIPGTASAVRIRNGRLQIQDPDTGLFYDLVARSVGGAPQSSVEGDGEE